LVNLRSRAEGSKIQAFPKLKYKTIQSQPREKEFIIDEDAHVHNGGG